MNRVARTLLSSCLALALPFVLSAQRGGHGGGGHFAGPTVRNPNSLGNRLGGRPFRVPHNTALPPGLTPPAAAYTGINPGALKSHGGRGRLPYAYFAAPYYYPSYPLLDYSDTATAPDYGAPYDPNAEAAAMAQDALMEQVQRLSAQVSQLQAAQQPQTPPAAQPEAPPPPHVPVTLILRNGQELQVQNYAVMDKTFWDLTNQAARKIPISNIDVAASAKATEASGGEFPQLEPAH